MRESFTSASDMAFASKLLKTCTTRGSVSGNMQLLKVGVAEARISSEMACYDSDNSMIDSDTV